MKDLKKNVRYVVDSLKYTFRFLIPMMTIANTKLDPLAKVILKKEDMLEELKKDGET